MNILSCFLFAAHNATVAELPPCDYADTEVSTNFPVAVEESVRAEGRLPGLKLLIR